MAIVQIPSSTVIPKQPKVYVYHNATSASGTYYTLVNATNTRGFLSKITISFDSGGNTFLNIRVTADGVVNTIGNPTAQYGALGLLHYNAGVAYDATNSIDYFCGITFYNSLLIEFMQNSGTTKSLVGNVMYSTE